MKLKFFTILLALFACNVLASAEDRIISAIYFDFRTQVMTIQAMKDCVSEASASGVNAVVVEWEATFPFEENLTLRNKYSFTREEVEDFISYCASLGVEVIPLQNCFGHAEYILRHERYAHLRESKKDCSQVCPMKGDNAEAVFKTIFGEIAAMHPSGYMHIGCDETRLLGQCNACKAEVERHGVSKLYVDYVSRMCKLVKDYGKTPMIWADIILKYPEALSELPDDVVIVDWNYGWKPDHFGKMENILSSGHMIWGACAIRSHPDNLYLVQWRKHLDNIFEYSKYATEHGFSGIINTSWSTSGTYGYIWDDANVVVNMQPVREVYPASAFSLLNDAFFSCISGRFSDVDTFVRDWAVSRLGLKTDSEVDAVLDYVNMKQRTAASMKGSSDTIDDEIRKCKSVLGRFASIKEVKSASSIVEQMELMLEIRINYLEFIRVESITESPDFKMSDAPGILTELRRIQSDTERLRKKYSRLNGKYLKDPMTSFNDWTYYGRILNLTEVMKNLI